MNKRVMGKSVLLAMWAAAAATIVTAAVHPDFGAAWDSPAATIAMGMVGLGLCLHARQRVLAGGGTATSDRE